MSTVQLIEENGMSMIRSVTEALQLLQGKFFITQIASSYQPFGSILQHILFPRVFFFFCNETPMLISSQITLNNAVSCNFSCMSQITRILSQSLIICEFLNTASVVYNHIWASAACTAAFLSTSYILHILLVFSSVHARVGEHLKIFLVLYISGDNTEYFMRALSCQTVCVPIPHGAIYS